MRPPALRGRKGRSPSFAVALLRRVDATLTTKISPLQSFPHGFPLPYNSSFSRFLARFSLPTEAAAGAVAVFSASFNRRMMLSLLFIGAPKFSKRLVCHPRDTFPQTPGKHSSKSSIPPFEQRPDQIQIFSASVQRSPGQKTEIPKNAGPSLCFCEPAVFEEQVVKIYIYRADCTAGPAKTGG